MSLISRGGKQVANPITVGVLQNGLYRRTTGHNGHTTAYQNEPDRREGAYGRCGDNGGFLDS